IIDGSFNPSFDANNRIAYDPSGLAVFSYSAGLTVSEDTVVNADVIINDNLTVQYQGPLNTAGSLAFTGSGLNDVSIPFVSFTGGVACEFTFTVTATSGSGDTIAITNNGG